MKHIESAEQISFFRMASLRRYLGEPLSNYLAAIPNAGTTGGHRAMLAGVRRKAEGVKAGFPDIECVIAVPPYSGWHCEMKRPRKDGGKDSDVSEAQNDWILRLEACGRKCVVAFGCTEAWASLCEYLKIKP